MKTPENTLNLDNPADARKLLRGVRIEGHAIKFLRLADGTQLIIDEMTDSQAVFYAKELYLDLLGGFEGEAGTIELDPSAELQ